MKNKSSLKLFNLAEVQKEVERKGKDCEEKRRENCCYKDCRQLCEIRAQTVEAGVSTSSIRKEGFAQNSFVANVSRAIRDLRFLYTDFLSFFRLVIVIS